MIVHARSRGTILVASANAVFADVVGGMVLDNGFKAAYPTGVETPWVTVARTQPRLVICDCDAPIGRIERLLLDVSVRRVPLVLSRAPDTGVDTRSLTLPPRFALATFPMSHLAFSAMLDALLPTVIESIDPARARVEESKIDPAMRIRALSIAPRGSVMDRRVPVAELDHAVAGSDAPTVF